MRTTRLASAYRALTERAGLLDRSERGKLALTGAQAAKAFLNGQVTNDVEALAPGHGCYAALLTPQGQDARRPARARRPATSCCSTRERAALQALFDVIRRGAIGCDAELHKRTLQQRAAVADRAARPRGRRRRGRAARRGALERRGRDRRRRRSCSSRPTSASTSLCAADDTARVRDALVAAGAVAVAEAAAEILRVEPAARATAIDLDDDDDPPGGRAQRARRQLHEGLLRRPGDGRAAALARASRTATCAGCGCPSRSRRGAALRLGEREVGQRRRASSVSPRLRPDRARDRAPRGRPGRHARGRRRRALTAQVVDAPLLLGRLRARGSASAAGCRHRVRLRPRPRRGPPGRVQLAPRLAQLARPRDEALDVRAPGARARSSVAASWLASHVATIRASSTSSGASDVVAPVPSPAAQRGRRARARRRRGRRAAPSRRRARRRARSASKRAAARVLGEHQPRPRVASPRARRRGARAARRAARAGAAATPRARSARPRRPRASAPSTWASSARAAVAAAGEQRERLVEPAAVEVRVEVAQARRQAAAHLPVGRRTARSGSPRPQWRSPNSELSCSTQLDGERAAAQRPDVDRRARARARARPRAPGTRCPGGSAGRRSRRRA